MVGSRGTSTVIKAHSLGYAILWIVFMWLGSFCALCLNLYSPKADPESNISVKTIALGDLGAGK